ncbi:hypothetical protein HPB48_026509 [Haemaphysalis longicornis]|uniref:Uncharacterized protein n=1 Tax=Haemaphysalis longicornis TaxID=44386 RepID=A0A9J6HCH0_HAELO|nr:hypothetical protein HPB48_026509 [Haemaphysalis longicornis]
MAYENSEEQYHELYSLLQMSASQSVVEYFNENWHSIHAEWVMGLKWFHGNFFNSTNIRAESMNCKLKKLVEHFSSLEEFVNRSFAQELTAVPVLSGQQCCCLVGIFFALRDELNMPRFEQALCAERWFLDGYIRSYGSTGNVDHDEARAPTGCHSG